MLSTRLKKNWEFKRVYRNGRTVVSKNIVLYYCPNRKEHNRIGYSISKRVGKSVTRNRIRRIFKEAYNQVNPYLQQGFDIILVARKPAAAISFHEASKELNKLCQKGDLLTKKILEQLKPLW